MEHQQQDRDRNPDDTAPDSMFTDEEMEFLRSNPDIVEELTRYLDFAAPVDLEDRDIKKICENPEQGLKLCLTEEGDLCVLKEEGWRNVAFAEVYRGKYPPCVFQDILYAREDFYAAATTEDGLAAVYSSATGELWSPVNLKEMHYWADGRPPRGGAVRLFLEPCMNQILLVCSGGDVVILPECPKCVKIMHVTDRTVTDADYRDHHMTLTDENGETERVSVATKDAIRVSLSYAKKACEEGGELIDIRPDDVRAEEGPIPCTAAMDPEALDDYLQTKDKDARLYFMCSYGTVSDQAAWHAYFEGFTNARSVGGFHEGLHID